MTGVLGNDPTKSNRPNRPTESTDKATDNLRKWNRIYLAVAIIGVAVAIISIAINVILWWQSVEHLDLTSIDPDNINLSPFEADFTLVGSKFDQYTNVVLNRVGTGDIPIDRRVPSPEVMVATVKRDKVSNSINENGAATFSVCVKSGEHRKCLPNALTLTLTDGPTPTPTPGLLPPTPLPDLVICGLDSVKKRIEFCNLGNSYANVDFQMRILRIEQPFEYRLVEGKFNAPGHLHAIPPQGDITFDIGIAEIQESDQIILDPTNRVIESNETNNCINGKNELISCPQLPVK